MLFQPIQRLNALREDHQPVLRVRRIPAALGALEVLDQALKLAETRSVDGAQAGSEALQRLDLLLFVLRDSILAREQLYPISRGVKSGKGARKNSLLHRNPLQLLLLAGLIRALLREGNRQQRLKRRLLQRTRIKV